MIIRNKMKAAILCGGKSSRMGFDKALICLPNGEPLLLHTTKTLNFLFDEIILITNNKDKFNKIFNDQSTVNVSIIEDHYIEKGPLGGICTALETINDSSIFIMAGDIAFPDVNLIINMLPFVNQYDIILCKQKEKLEPLFGFYSQTCLSVFRDQIQQDDMKIRKNFHLLSVKYLHLRDEDQKAFINLNQPEDLDYL